MPISSPIPYFGSKAYAAERVWSALGNVNNYVEPFAGSLGVLLNRPGGASGIETVNDLNDDLMNFWMAVKLEPEVLIDEALSYPIAERALESIYLELLNPLEEYDPQRAGKWFYYATLNLPGARMDKSPQLKLSRLAGPCLSYGTGAWQGKSELMSTLAWFKARLRNVRIMSGDWQRALRPSITTAHDGVTGVFLDPPYKGYEAAYGDVESTSSEVCSWCSENGISERLRIVLCGYGDEHDALLEYGWAKQSVLKRRGMQKAKEHTGKLEAMWLSPHCVRQGGLFDAR